MIARLFLWLPYKVLVPIAEPMPLLNFKSEEIEGTLHPLQQFSHFDGPIPQFRLPPAPSSRFTLDSQPAAEMDVLVVDVRNPDFDRAIKKSARDEPAVRLAFDAANTFLESLREISKSPYIRPVENDFVLVFLSDSGDALPEEKDKCRIISQISLRAEIPVVTPDIWKSLLSYTPNIRLHRTLMLDAHALFPEPASLVLAFSAVEAATRLIIETRARAAHPATVGQWLGSPKRFREARVESLLRGPVFGLTGIELEKESDFWTGFQDLLDARNSVVHEGRPVIRNRPLDKLSMRPLLTSAEALIARLEELALLAPQPISNTSFRIRRPLLSWGDRPTDIHFGEEPVAPREPDEIGIK